MNAERLLAHYEEIAEAPFALAHMRRFIVELAIRGALSTQDPKEEPDPDLLTRLDRLSTPSARSLRNWIHTSVGEMLDFQYGKGLGASEREDFGPVPVYGSNGIVGFTSAPLTQRSAIIVGRKGSAGALNICAGPSWTTDVAYFVEVPKYFDINYLFHALTTLDLDTLSKGVKPGLSRSDVYNLPLAVPPLAEQRRIVAKVDELMTLCDELEAARTEREAARDRLTTATLARLNTPNPETFQTDARFALDALPAITARPDQIKLLRETILSLAVLGKLVSQDTSDEPASELLARIAVTKERLIMEGGGRTERATHRTSPRADLDTPSGWAWTNLQSICLSITDGDHQAPPRAEAGVPFLVIGDVRSGTINYNADRWVPQQYYRALDTTRRPRSGDLLYTLVGSFGIPVLVRENRAFCVQRHIGILRPSAEISAEFLARVLASRLVFDQAEACATGIAQKTVPLSGLRAISIPLPPRQEQDRIVAKVDELMAICDELDGGLASADSTRRNLLEALLSEALSDTPRTLEAAE